MQVRLYNQGTVNKNIVHIGELTLYFSYETIVAYNYKGEFACRQNDWSTTTGKFLNEIEPDKDRRIDGVSFEKRLNILLNKLKLS